MEGTAAAPLAEPIHVNGASGGAADASANADAGSTEDGSNIVVAVGEDWPEEKEPMRARDWDPFRAVSREPTAQCLRRVQREVRQICQDPPPGCFVFPDDKQSTVLHCLVAGTADTPYEGGMFYFYIACPDDYPMQPPRVKILTGLGKCRFNPNLYKDGKVCLSILNTWHGPVWSPVLSIASVLMSIQSLMNAKPYHNEPGFEEERYPGECEAYNDVVRHETLRYAVLGMLTQLDQGSLPRCFAPVMEDIFLTMFEGYEECCEEGARLDGQSFRDHLCTNRGTFQFGAILGELRVARDRILQRRGASGAIGAEELEPELEPDGELDP